MNAPTITRFYTDDHERLDALFRDFQAAKGGDPERALALLEAFKAGLEQHMAWEESILFGEYDERVPSPDDESPTVHLAFEHQQIRDRLDDLFERLRSGDRATAPLEKRIMDLLASHNRDEEEGLYRELDERLTAAEREAIHRQMRDAAIEKP